ncbi:ORF MSV216 SCG gene family protein [Melanoplus sanguinipes entomopoxvirus]|uniref:ORF MSV216 SCG gene family protein n=1 Tax=Melanoplus sanguinipes entomopoxvirus TaxID=83191 RepID=Q9YVM6_MSEPV|nr:ORF MSV216 SCG gene family protein [Melanoplus sanguinipes entomopoxvirus]AAC97749.1 ORF MSV216 SCG gene family protein [Melanoplus sanguinipes entomopoxvirus 'O']
MKYIYFVIVGIVFIIYLFIFTNYYTNTNVYNVLNNTLTEISNNILSKINTKDYSNNIILYGLSSRNNSIYRSLDGIQYEKNIPSIVFFNNFLRNEYVNNENKYLNFPNNNLNKSSQWIYGGWFINANANLDAICVRSNNLNNFNRFYGQFYESYIQYDPSDDNDHIIVSKILYKNQIDILLINVTKISQGNIISNDYFQYTGKILTYIKKEIIKDNLFILFCDNGLNGKYNKLIIDTVFGDDVITSCYDGVITYARDNTFTQSIFFCIKKSLCENGVKFGLKYPISDPTPFTNILLYAIIYNEPNENEYFNDPLTITILESIKSSSNYDNKYVEWNLIDTSTLDTNFENIYVFKEEKYISKKNIESLLNK